MGLCDVISAGMAVIEFIPLKSETAVFALSLWSIAALDV
jgi:hypothetical protein